MIKLRWYKEMIGKDHHRLEPKMTLQVAYEKIDRAGKRTGEFGDWENVPVFDAPVVERPAAKRAPNEEQ